MKLYFVAGASGRGKTAVMPHLKELLKDIILGCTEYPLVVDQDNSILTIVDPVYLQAVNAVNYALDL